MIIDVNTFIGPYAWRALPETDADALAGGLAADDVVEAWVSHLGAILWRDPTAGNDLLAEAERRYPKLRAVPAVHPGLHGWERLLRRAADTNAPAVRCDPSFYGIDAAGTAMRRLVAASGEAGVALVLTVKLEDVRQRHPNDTSPELTAAAIRSLARVDPRSRLLVAGADRAIVEEVHFGCTPDESSRIWWDIGWIWGPPEDHLALLIGTVGAERFVFGSARPLRLPESARAKLDLLDVEAATRSMIAQSNARRLSTR
jgi:uncharacterized protein